ncbi:hypothetical protein [Halobacteriovorax sp. HLS]|uniref:hypothetical protein n=1 Tax=Halobacteriovorax sp. HLS TaxID=2234000 RepID=UPI000FD6C4F6|nr:hypothetical protein [Halobacteriovorax sp. HLS]
MAKLKFDGTKLKDGGRTIANVSGDRIREGTGSRTVLNISGDKVREGTGSRTLFNVSGDKIREGTGSRKIADMDDVDKSIDGPGKVVKAALWFYFVR